MADISQIKLPDGNTYDIKDTTARSLINGIFVLAWNGAAAPTVANIPAGIQVTYNSTIYTGTLAANNNANTSTLGKIYLVKSTTLPDDDDSDIYNEYVTVDNGASAGNNRYTWEKLGDTRIKLGNIVTNVELDKKTATVVGTGAKLKVSTQPAFNVTPNTTYVKGTASGTNVVYTPTDDNKDTFVKSVSATTKKLVTTTVTGVSGSVTASKVSAGTDQTTAKGTGTASTSTDAWIKGWSVSNELLTLGGVTMDTQTTTQVNIDTASVTVPKAASATRVATGALADTDSNGATIATGVSTSGSGQTAKALVSLPAPTITQPTISLSTNNTGGTGQATVAANTQVAADRAANVAIAWDGQDSKTVLLNTTSVTVTKAT